MCLLMIALPGCYLSLFHYNLGLKGLWIGYGLSALVLSICYFIILWRLDWEATAQWASSNEDYSCMESSSDDKSSTNSVSDLDLSINWSDRLEFSNNKRI